MAQQPPPPEDTFWDQLTAPYPSPPPFWKQFTTANLNRLKAEEAKPDFDPTDLTYELLVLRPPPPPPAEVKTYTAFSQTHSISPQPTLPPEHEELLFRTEELTKATGTARPHLRLLWQLTKSLNLNFLELFTIMADDPIDYQDKVNDIGMLTENINAVLNLLRPHQAREHLKTILLERLDRGREELEKCREMTGEVEEFLARSQEEGMGRKGSDTAIHKSNGSVLKNASTELHEKKAKEMEEARKMWAMLDEMDGD